MNSQLDDLIARVEGARGGDREIDMHLLCLREGLVLKKLIKSQFDAGQAPRFVAFRTDNGDVSCYDVPRFTASLDAALALCESVLPGWRVQLFERDDEDGGGWNARLRHRSPYGSVALDEVAPVPRTAPLALVAVLLRAVKAKGEGIPHSAGGER